MTVTSIHDEFNHPVIVIVVRTMQNNDPTNHQTNTFLLNSPRYYVYDHHDALEGIKSYMRAGPGFEPAT